MSLNPLKWIFGGGLNGIASELRGAYADKLTAQTDEAKIVADVTIGELKARQQALETAASIRKASGGYWEMRLMVFVAGFFPSAHFAAVSIVSVFPNLNWTVQALPAPMDEWQGSIILSLFGLSAVKIGVSTIGAVIGRRK